MNQKIKILGLVFVAALALAAVIAPAAHAQFTFSPSITLTGTQAEAHKFVAGPGIGGITCTTSTLHGTAASTGAHSLVMSPAYSGCKDSLGRTVHITKNTASFRFTSGATAGETKGDVDISGEIVWTVTTSFGHCTITVGSQTVNGVSYKALGGTSGLEVSWNTTNFHSAHVGGAFSCGTSATTSSTGIYVGTTVVTAKDAAGTPLPVYTD
jgi:hypothetical protein